MHECIYGRVSNHTHLQLLPLLLEYSRVTVGLSVTILRCLHALGFRRETVTIVPLFAIIHIVVIGSSASSSVTSPISDQPSKAPLTASITISSAVYVPV